MNERFKFRVWDKYIQSYVKENLGEEYVWIEDDGQLGAGIDDSCILEQCTGLKDKNGNLIYEGDLLTDGRDIGQVLWTGAGWGCTAFLFKKKPETLKICGNIHEQPEQKDK